MKTPVRAIKCPVALTTRVMGGKWKARLIWALQRRDPDDGAMRFSDLRRACPPISDRILSHELKALEAWELIVRTQVETSPPVTEYRLSEFGKTLEPIMAAMAKWGNEHRSKLTE